MQKKPTRSKPAAAPAGKKDVSARKKPSSRWQEAGFRTAVGYAVIAMTAFIVFSPSLRSEFQGWDDYNYIRDNALIRSLTWDNLVHIFNFRTIVVGNYHPLTILTYILEYHLVGLNPFLYHFDNLLLHLLNTGLVCLFMWRLTGRQPATLLVTALFALHPMRVESVVWAAERKDVLYTFFFLLSLLSYLRFRIKKTTKMRDYGLSLLFFTLSLLSKGQAVVLPLVLILVDWWLDKKLTIRLAANKIPFLLLALASGIIALLAQHNSLTEQRLLSRTWPERIIIALFNVTAYLYKLVFPFNLSNFYKYPAPGDMGWVYAGAVATVLIMIAVAVFLRRNRVVVFGFLYYLATLSIVTQILPVGNAILADRYTYIPYIGLFFLAGMGYDHMVTTRRNSRTWLVTAVVVLLLVFSVKSYLQAGVWHDNFSLWENALRHDPDNGVAYNNLGQCYLELKDYDRAIPLLKEAVRNEATFVENHQAYQNLGVAYSGSGKQEEAIRFFTEALTRRTEFAEAYFGRGLAFSALGKYEEAVADFSRIIDSLNPRDPRAYYSRGIVFNRMKQPDRALEDYTNAIRIDPGYGGAYVNRGNIYYSRDQLELALADYNKALQADPSDGNTFLNRSFVHFRLKKYREAYDDALQARELKMQVHPQYLEDLAKAIKGG